MSETAATSNSLLRLAAIDYLNPAPLMWNFEHAAATPALRERFARYTLYRMTPAASAQALANKEADAGLIPIGAYAAMQGLLVVPGCAIASLGSIRSLLLVLRDGLRDGNESEAREAADQEPDLLPPTDRELASIQTVALDTSSRTSALYTQILFRRFWGHTPEFIPHAPNLDAMLATADAALLIGDPALHALRDRATRETRTGERLRYLDLGHLWREATGTAWVSAFWAVRAESLERFSPAEQAEIALDFTRSRDAGLEHIPELVAEWAPRLQLRPGIVQTYLTRNIHYLLDASAIAGVERFFAEALALGLIPEPASIAWMQNTMQITMQNTMGSTIPDTI
jgi:chorismate dehydratase